VIELHLPHQDPIKFAKYVMSKSQNQALVKVEFESVPTLSMIVEAAAQASGAFGGSNTGLGFLVSLKNIKLLEKPQKLHYKAKIINEHTMDSMTYFSFEFIQESSTIATGSFVITVQFES
jgi:hypothetical protein